MDQGLKERLIGAAVLVALGVWLIPWLLDGRQEQVELETSSSAVRLPAPDSPLPVRKQTLSLDAEKSDSLASEPHPDAVEPASTPAPVTDTTVAAAEPTSPAPAPPQESATALKQPAAAKPPADHGAAPQRVATAAVPAPAAASKPAPKPAATAPAASPQAAPARGDWAVQLGSFGAEENAKKLAVKVNVYGYKPEVASIRASGRAMYRVRLGPYRSRAEADATASALSAHGFSPQVVAAD
jgi:DedD protein